MNPPAISLLELGYCLALVVGLGVVSLRLGLRLERDLAWASARSVLQLLLLGSVLHLVFGVERGWIIVLVLLGMVAFAAWTVATRLKQKPVGIFWPTFISMALSYLVLTFFATGAVLGVEPWYSPHHVIPLGGMLVGNSMNAIAVSLDRLFAGLEKDRRLVEQWLSLGAEAREASAFACRDAVRAGLIPTINSMLTVGIVFIPGMMTGQILSGVDPILAVRYQIMILLLILVATGLGSVLVTRWVARRCFTAHHQLRLPA
ncbi:MAG: iron export ABC transporter permease subunit FetB [Puniceicoccaceae bacterium]|nr:MAG: iron export ABC transporter permease subunit FetB [Puniceicoccaceae bacterium]